MGYKKAPLPSQEELLLLFQKSRTLKHLMDQLPTPRPNSRRVMPLLAELGISLESFPDYGIKFRWSPEEARRLGIAAGDSVRERRRKSFEIDILPNLFVRNSIYTGQQARAFVRRWNRDFHFLEEKCQGEGCVLSDVWLGKKIVLQIDHKNGDSRDHRLINLRFLCPNCHSQTDTFTGKNSWKVKLDSPVGVEP